MSPPRFAFFGTEPLAHAVLDELEKAGMLPALVVAAPDKVARAKSIVFPTEKAWALARGIPVVQPERMTPEFIAGLAQSDWDTSIVASYGKILPKELLDVPERGTISLHPSLLPKLRGPSPMRSAILHDEKETGVSIILVDEEMDHGSIVAQKKVAVPNWPVKNSELEKLLVPEGGRLLAQVLPEYVAGHIEPREQTHDLATYSEKFSKEDGLLDLKADPYKNLLKIKAFEGWPGTFAFFERSGRRIRVAILDAHIEHAALILDAVKPEGQRKKPYADFARSL